MLDEAGIRLDGLIFNLRTLEVDVRQQSLSARDVGERLLLEKSAQAMGQAASALTEFMNVSLTRAGG